MAIPKIIQIIVIIVLFLPPFSMTGVEVDRKLDERKDLSALDGKKVELNPRKLRKNLKHIIKEYVGFAIRCDHIEMTPLPSSAKSSLPSTYATKPSKPPNLDQSSSPTTMPTILSSKLPTVNPSNLPTKDVNRSPTTIPSEYFTKIPNVEQSNFLTTMPKMLSSKLPTVNPSNLPIKDISENPTDVSSVNTPAPTIFPSLPFSFDMDLGGEAFLLDYLFDSELLMLFRSSLI